MRQYIVVNEFHSGPRELLARSNRFWKKVPEGGILLNGGSGVATVFPSQIEARLAIVRTVDYFKREKGLGPGEPGQSLDELFKVVRLVPPERGA